MAKFFIFTLLWYILGNPFLAILILLFILYIVDRRFIGITPSITRPLRRMRQIRKLKEELRINPHHTSMKHELARLLMERRKYSEASKLLEQVKQRMDDSDDVKAELGICYLYLGRVEEAERILDDVLSQNPKVKYGEPFLVLAETLAKSEPTRAIGYLKQFQEVDTSSCQAYYRLGQLYTQLGEKQESIAAYREAKHIYRALPKYKRKSERRWALLCSLRSMGR